MHLIRCSAVLVGLIGLSVACEHKSQRDDMGGNPAPKANDQPTQPSEDPSPAARAKAAKAATPPATGSGSGAATVEDAVRKPTKEDLATYTKDIPGNGKLTATIETSMGTIHCELFPDKAPMTVANFVGLATGKKAWSSPAGTMTNKPYFDGLTFHRVISGFMIQGGDPTGTGTGGPGYSFQDEFADGTEMGPGALAMANAGKGPDGGGTNGSQFFIMEGSRPDLVGHHTIFGQCKEVDVVKKITAVPKNSDDKPNTPVTITKISFAKV
jgi:peptidyl-prolyl cis-trans isomerase A (cyclophilin A)